MLTKQAPLIMLIVMQLTIIGSGTSHGIPVIGCCCATCCSIDSKDKRMRCSALLEDDRGTTVCIDTGPEFRIQALRSGLKKLDAVLLTHAHADHVHGLDDVRIFSASAAIPVYGCSQTLADVKNRFDYIFKHTQNGGGKPHLDLCDCARYSPENPLIIGDLPIIPIPLIHGDLIVTGWRIHNTAYLTDTNSIPESSYKLLEGIDQLIIDALRSRPHVTHFNFEQAITCAARIGAKKVWFTHICHDYTHKTLQSLLPRLAQEQNCNGTVLPAWDGLRITL